MINGAQLLLIASVVAVGVLHTMVPDHWGPIAILARQRGWTRGETARAAAQAGAGHVVTTMLFGIVVWIIGTAAAQRFGVIVDELASVALIGFGLWIAFGAWREMREARHEHDGPDDHGHHHGDHGHDQHGHHLHHHGLEHNRPGWARDPLYTPLRIEAVAERHVHIHRHGFGPAHMHWHDHAAATAHANPGDFVLNPPLHDHKHGTSGRTALLLVLGSSPMVEGIPAFFAASRYGIATIAVMATLFAASTIVTYVVLSVGAASGLQRLKLGAVEEYGEIISGLFVALVGLIFGLMSL
jgi:hypothetical protein